MSMPNSSKTPQWGDSRWNCECGWQGQDCVIALRHALSKHRCVFEVYADRRWRNDGVTVGDMILMGHQQRGEDVDEFRERLKVIAQRPGIAEAVE